MAAAAMAATYTPPPPCDTLAAFVQGAGLLSAEAELTVNGVVFSLRSCCCRPSKSG